MPRLTDRQLLSIFESASLIFDETAIWDALTPKQRLRAEWLAERDDDRRLTKPKLMEMKHAQKDAR